MPSALQAIDALAQFRELALELGDALLQAVRRSGCRFEANSRFAALAEQLCPTLPALAGTVRQLRDELPLGECREPRFDIRDGAERIEALASCAQLGRGLRPAEHEHGEQREL